MNIQFIALLAAANLALILGLAILITRKASAVATEQALDRLLEQKGHYETMDQLFISQYNTLTEEYGKAQQRIGAVNALQTQAEQALGDIARELKSSQQNARDTVSTLGRAKLHLRELAEIEEQLKNRIGERKQRLEEIFQEIRSNFSAPPAPEDKPSAEEAGDTRQTLKQIQELIKTWEDLDESLPNSGLDQLPLGTIIFFGGEKAPDGWLLCDGRSLKADEATPYGELYKVIGDKWTQEGDKKKGLFRLPSLVEEDYALPTLIKFK